MKIVLLKELNPSEISRLTSSGAGCVIYCRLLTGTSEKDVPAGISIVYAYKELRETIAYAFNRVSQLLSELKKQVPAVFTYKGLDLLHALEKEVFWGTMENFAVEFQLNRIRKEGDTVIDRLSRPAIKKQIGLISQLFGKAGFHHEFSIGERVPGDVVAFRINKADQVGLLGNLLSKISSEKTVSFQTTPTGTPDQLDGFLTGFFARNIKSRKKRSPKRKMGFGARISLLRSGMDADLKNVVARSYFMLVNHADQYERLFASGVRKVFLLAAENEGEGNVADMVAERRGAMVYNYANGTKANDPQNVHTHFSYWFMPDSATQRVFSAHGYMKESQLPITGHLMEEKARDHRYTGSLDQFSELISGKKIIALFTSIFYVEERTEVLAFLAGFLDRHPETIVLVRKHPRDKTVFGTGHERIVVLPPPGPGEGDRTLFDLLARSVAAITFTSTTSLQASWFGILSVNFEHSPFPKLAYVDNVSVFHADSAGRLDALLTGALSDPDAGKNKTPAASPADEIAGYLLA